MNVQDKVIAIIEEQLGLPKGEVLLTSTKESLGMDSLDKIETIMALEEEFDIEINDHQAEKFITVQDVVDFIKVNQLYSTMSALAYNDAKKVFSQEYNSKSIHDVVDKNKYPLSYTYKQLEGKDLVAHKNGYMDEDKSLFCKKGNIYKIDLVTKEELGFIDETGDIHYWDLYDVGEYFYPVDKVKDNLYNPVKNISQEKYRRCVKRLTTKLYRSNNNGSCLWMHLSKCGKHYYWCEYNSKNDIVYFRGEVDWVESNYDDYEHDGQVYKDGIIVSFDSSGVVSECKWDSRELGCDEEHVSTVEITEADEYTGSSVSYYKLKVDNPTTIEYPYEVECNDIIEALDMNYAEGNAFKGLWRRCAARKFGLKKKGYDNGLYDAEKVVFFGERLVEQSKTVKV